MALNPIRIFIVDDNEGYHTLFRDILDGEPQFECVGTALGGEAALRQIPQAKPDIILLNYVMMNWRAGRYINGDETLTSLHDLYPSAVVIATSALPEAEAIMESVGAVGFISYPFDNADVIQTLRDVAKRYVNREEG